MKKIFVYGTLRKGMYNYDIYLKEEKTYRCHAFVKGTLYTIKNQVYPALVLEGQNKIVGEIHEVSDQTLEKVHQMEGYIAKNHIDNEYDVVDCDVYDQNNHIIERLPVYVYNTRNPKKKELLDQVISCNDYIEYIQKTTSK